MTLFSAVIPQLLLGTQVEKNCPSNMIRNGKHCFNSSASVYSDLLLFSLCSSSSSSPNVIKLPCTENYIPHFCLQLKTVSSNLYTHLQSIKIATKALSQEMTHFQLRLKTLFRDREMPLASSYWLSFGKISRTI